MSPIDLTLARCCHCESKRVVCKVFICDVSVLSNQGAAVSSAMKKYLSQSSNQLPGYMSWHLYYGFIPV